MSTASATFGHIDEIAYLDAIAGSTQEATHEIPQGALLTARGWIGFADCAFATGVYATIDDGPPIELHYGIERQDVAAAMNDERFAKTGFRGVLSTAHLELGEHRLRVALRDGDGAFVPLATDATFTVIESFERRLRESPASPLATPIVIDEISIGPAVVTEPVAATQADRIAIRGWAIDEPASALAKGVYAIVGSTSVRGEYGASRDDVATHFDDDRLRACGFTIDIPLDALEPGPHAIRLRVLGTDDRTLYEAPPIAIDVAPIAAAGALAPGGVPTLGTVDKTIVFDMLGRIVSTSVPLVLTRGDQLFLSGWAIDEPGDATARAVHVCVDGMVSTPAVYGIERRDVARHFHRPDLVECGFTALVTTASMPAGPHSAIVRVIDRSGTRFYDSQQRIDFVLAEHRPG